MSLPEVPYAVEVMNLSKHFDDAIAVDQVNLQIRQGEIFALLGGSGCGKTTLLRMLAGFEQPSEGDIRINGVSMADSPPYQRPVNMMFQSYALFPHMTVEQNIAFGLKQDKLPQAQIAERVSEMLALVRMTTFRRRKPAQLSGGQQQRIALARSLAKKPALLLLDEPMGALDKKLRMQMQLELAHIIEGVGVTCVMVTHDQEEAMTMADRIAIMDQGRIMQVGEPREIYEYPNSKMTAEFIGSINLFKAVASFGSSSCELICNELSNRAVAGNIGREFEGDCYVALRPEKIRLAAGATLAKENSIAGKVEDIAYLGSHNVIHVRLNSIEGQAKIVQVHVSNFVRHAAQTFELEQPVVLSWDRDAIVLIKADPL